MLNEGGEWIIRGLSQRDSNRIKTVDELIAYVKEEGRYYSLGLRH